MAQWVEPFNEDAGAVAVCSLAVLSATLIDANPERWPGRKGEPLRVLRLEDGWGSDTAAGVESGGYFNVAFVSQYSSQGFSQKPVIAQICVQ